MALATSTEANATRRTLAAYQIADVRAFIDTAHVRSLRWLVLVGVTACAEPGTPFYTRGGPIVENGNVVYFGAVAAEFGSNTVALPLHISANGADILHPAETCTPGLVGLSLYPAMEVNAATQAPSRNPLVTEWPGRAVARVRADIDAPFQCGSSQSQFTGSSTFMFFSNDRIVRIDENIQPSSVALADDACTCSGTPDPYSLKTFWSFRNGTVFNTDFMPGPVTNKPACIDLGDVMVAVRYEGTDSTISATTGVPIAEQQLLPQSSTTWAAGQMGTRSVSHIALSVGNDRQVACREAIEKITYPTVFVENDAVPVVEGIYRATAKTYTSPVRVTVPQMINQNFVLELDMGSVDHVRVSLPDRILDTYVVQQLGNHLLLDLPALNDGMELTIESI
jgi:hypothetical protein